MNSNAEMRYICIDLKSFYGSVECVERGLDPLNTNLVVADETRTDKTICLAVTPPLKKYGIPGRPRLFEVVQQVDTINAQRLNNEPYREFTDTSYIASELDRNPSLKLDYIIAPPQMKRYMEVSSQIYGIYLRYIAPEDIHVYSVDEVFIDAQAYLQTYNCTVHELAMMLIREVLKETGITATAGIGTNLYLAKVAMDIVAKKMPADADGVRIAELDEQSYRTKLWDHRPITDFWRIGHGIASRLEKRGLFTMGDIAAFSETGEDEHFKMFGINAELIIDHAWGRETCTMEAIKSYQPTSQSISQGQVLSHPYTFQKARLIVQEMAEQLILDLVNKEVVTDQLTLYIGYDHTGVPQDWNGKLETGMYGRLVPRPVHSSINLERHTSSHKMIMKAAGELYDKICDPSLLVRRLSIAATHIVPVTEANAEEEVVQYSLFEDVEALERKRKEEEKRLAREDNLQKAILGLKHKYGKNSVLKGMNFLDGATAITRNEQVGGHRA